MNPIEARERFRSAAGDDLGHGSGISLDEAKQRFRENAAALDRKIGLDKDQLEYGGWTAALFFIATLFSSGRTRSWLMPLLTGLVSFSGKAVDALLGMFTHKPKQKSPPKSRRAKHSSS